MKRCAPGIRIFCFGGFRIELEGGKTIQFSTDKSRALLVYLAVESDRAFRRSHLAGLLWSETGEEQGLHNLRQTLSLLRKVWEKLEVDDPLLLTDRDTVQLNPSIQLQVDLCAFENTLSEAYQYFQNHKDLTNLNIRQLIKALDYFRAPFLDRYELNNSQLFDEWALATRERTNQAAIEAFTLLCEYFERRGEYSSAADIARRIVELAPWDESAHITLMRLLAVNQHWSAAQNQYIQLEQYLKRNLAVAPTQETTAMYQKIRSAASANHLFPVQFPATIVHLPVLDKIVGRDQELDEISNMLANPKIHLITLTGVGGIGKTHLAVEIGRIQAGIFTDGVYFIPLLNLNTYEEFQEAVAKGLGLSLSENKHTDSQTRDYLRQKLALIILDNFEQLLADKQNLDFIVDILTHAPGVKFLVTSRERLNLQKEYRFVLDGLNYPPDVSTMKQPLQNFDSVSLFDKWSRKINQNFRLNEKNLLPVLKICNLLQGHPLGIELVISMTPQQNWEDLLNEFSNRLQNLDLQYTNAPAHHQTLRIVFDASWIRLSLAQQRTLSILSVCRGGFTKNTANFIAQATTELLDDLVGKSLLRQNQIGRFEFHEAVRQYAQEKLNQTAYAELALNLLTDHFSQSLHAYAENSNISNRTEFFDWIDLEYENLRTTWEQLIQQQRTAEISTNLDLLYQFFNIRSRFAEGIAWLQSALTGLNPFPLDDPLLGMLKSRVGSLALRARKNDLAFECLSEGCKIASHRQDLKELAFCLIGLGGSHLRKKAYPAAQACAEQSLTYYQTLQDISGQSYAHYLIGLIHSRLGNYPLAKASLTQALSLGRQGGDRRRLIAPLNVLGDIACTEGNYDQAKKFFLEGLEISREMNDRFNSAILLNNLATIYQHRQQYSREEAVLLESLEICRDIGDQDGEAFALNNLGEMAVVQENYQDALNYSSLALKIAESLEEDWTIIVCLNNIGEAHFGLQNYSRAGIFFQSAAQRSLDIDAMDLLARVTINAAPVFFYKGEPETATKLLQAALAHSTTEYSFRKKATMWLKKMNIDEIDTRDDGLLPDTVQKVFSTG